MASKKTLLSQGIVLLLLILPGICALPVDRIQPNGETTKYPPIPIAESLDAVSGEELNSTSSTNGEGGSARMAWMGAAGWNFGSGPNGGFGIGLGGGGGGGGGGRGCGCQCGCGEERALSAEEGSEEAGRPESGGGANNRNNFTINQKIGKGGTGSISVVNINRAERSHNRTKREMDAEEKEGNREEEREEEGEEERVEEGEEENREAEREEEGEGVERRAGNRNEFSIRQSVGGGNGMISIKNHNRRKRELGEDEEEEREEEAEERQGHGHGGGNHNEFNIHQNVHGGNGVISIANHNRRKRQLLNAEKMSELETII